MSLRFKVAPVSRGNYNIATTYAILDEVTDPNGTGIYRSLVNSNVGNPLTDTTKWLHILDLTELKETVEDSVKTNNIIKSNEDDRTLAENARVSAETTRANNESTRINNENARLLAETGRADAETNRRLNETSRINNEIAINSAETSRNNAETERASAENSRVSAESIRVSSENTRVNQESTRVNSENTRIINEETRVSNENTRISNENIRQSNEGTDADTPSATGSRWARYKQAEHDRNTASSVVEGSQASSEAGDGTRWGTFLTNEAARDAKVDAKVSDITNLQETVQELENKKANKDGYYTEMSVGLAENLISPDGIVNEEPYIFRTTAGSTSVATGNAEIKKIKGNTIVWNQLVQNGNFADGGNTPTGWTLTAGIICDNTNDDYITINGTNYIGQYVPIYISKGHKLFYTARAKSNGAATENAYFYCDLIANGATDEIIGDNEWHIISRIGTISNNVSTSNELIKISMNGNTITIDKKYGVKVIDLTRIFGKGNEPATIEEFKAMYPLDYYNYNIGELISLKPDTLRTIGFNQWDEEWEIGSYNDNTGEFISGQSRICSNHTHKIPIFGGYFYYFKTNRKPINIMWFDANDNCLNKTLNTNNWYLDNGGLVKAPINAAYCKFYMGSNYGITYNNDICINLSWSGYKNGEYEPYNKRIVSLPITTIVDNNGNTLFPDGLRSTGSIYDEITSTKAIKRFGAVDLGTLNWDYTQPDNNYFPYGMFTATIPDITTVELGVISTFNAVNVKYEVKNVILTFTEASVVDKHCFRANSGGLQGKFVCITDSSYTDSATFKAAMSGVMLYYELETPIEVDFSKIPQSFGTTLNLTYAMDDFGTEEILVSNSTDEVPTTPMVHSTFYMHNLRDKIRNIDGNTDDGAMMNDSLTNLLLTLGTALNGTITKTWNETNNNWEFSFTPNTSK